MMSEVCYYVDERGIAPVRDYVLGLEEKQKAKVMAYIKFLSENGPGMRRPFADYLGDKTGIYELRPQRHRVLYFFYHRDKIILLHAFLKRTRELPQKDIRLAQDRKDHCEVLLKLEKVDLES